MPQDVIDLAKDAAAQVHARRSRSCSSVPKASAIAPASFPSC
jgi:hypothetical protein